MAERRVDRLGALRRVDVERAVRRVGAEELAEVAEEVGVDVVEAEEVHRAVRAEHSRDRAGHATSPSVKITVGATRCFRNWLKAQVKSSFD